MRLVLFAVLSFVLDAHVMFLLFYTNFTKSTRLLINFALRSWPFSVLVGEVDVRILFSVVLHVKILTLPGILIVFVPVGVLRT